MINVKIRGKESRDFPRLMIGPKSRIVIIATTINKRGGFCGTVIDPGTFKQYPTGYYSETWSCGFVSFDGEVTLKNE